MPLDFVCYENSYYQGISIVCITKLKCDPLILLCARKHQYDNTSLKL